MADFKLNGITPNGVGKIKLGSVDVQEIYMGSTLVWPISPLPSGQVQICDLIWTDVNSVSTLLTNGANMEIVTNFNDFELNTNQGIPCAFYYNFDIANSAYGLYYNQPAMQQIELPVGFRVPILEDWTNTRNCVALNAGTNLNALGISSSEWDWNIVDTTSLGSSGLNILPIGRASIYSPSSPFKDFGDSGYLWVKATPDSPFPDQLYGLIGSRQYLGQVNTAPQQACPIRFVKDA